MLSSLAIAATESDTILGPKSKTKIMDQLNRKVSEIEEKNNIISTYVVQQRLALLQDNFKLDERIAFKVKEPESRANLVDICRQLIEGKIDSSTDEILCDGKIKASLQISTAQSGGKTHIVELVEDELVHYEGSSEANSLCMRARCRMADALAKEHGFSGYSCLSFEELENAPDEKVFFTHLNQRLNSGAP